MKKSIERKLSWGYKSWTTLDYNFNTKEENNKIIDLLSCQITFQSHFMSQNSTCIWQHHLLLLKSNEASRNQKSATCYIAGPVQAFSRSFRRSTHSLRKAPLIANRASISWQKERTNATLPNKLWELIMFHELLHCCLLIS